MGAFEFLRWAVFRLRAVRGALVFGRWGIYLGWDARIEGARHIRIGSRFGSGRGLWLAAIDEYAGRSYSPSIRIGRNVSLGHDCHIAAIDHIHIGDNLLAGCRVHITDHGHGNYGTDADADSPQSIPLFRQLHSRGPVSIGNNVWIGDGAVILPNTRIGDGAVIGANAVVSRDVEAGTMVAGAPARCIKIFRDGAWHRASESVTRDE